MRKKNILNYFIDFFYSSYFGPQTTPRFPGVIFVKSDLLAINLQRPTNFFKIIKFDSGRDKIIDLIDCLSCFLNASMHF
jgi:hypothetical protein